MDDLEKFQKFLSATPNTLEFLWGQGGTMLQSLPIPLEAKYNVYRNIVCSTLTL